MKFFSTVATLKTAFAYTDFSENCEEVTVILSKGDIVELADSKIYFNADKEPCHLCWSDTSHVLIPISRLAFSPDEAFDNRTNELQASIIVALAAGTKANLSDDSELYQLKNLSSKIIDIIYEL